MAEEYNIEVRFPTHTLVYRAPTPEGAVRLSQMAYDHAARSDAMAEIPKITEQLRRMVDAITTMPAVN
jgi:hypothetical protein